MEVFDGLYDSFLALSMYESYSNGSRTNDVLNELLRQIGPLIAIVAKAEIGPNSMGEGNFDVLRVEALERVYEVFESRIIDTDDPREFTAYLWTTIRRAMLRTIEREARPWDYDGKHTYSDVDIDDVGTTCTALLCAEAKLYLSSFNQIVYSVFKADMRLTGSERDAALYVAKQMLAEDPPTSGTIRFRFGLSKARARFVTSYTRCSLKTSRIAVRRVDDAAS